MRNLLPLGLLAFVTATATVACSDGAVTVTTDPGVTLDYKSPVLLDCGPTSVVMSADVDGDGKNDLLTFCGSSSIVMRAYLGGNFDAPVETAKISGKPRLFDVDGDGMADIVTGNSIYFALGKGVFSSPKSATIPSGEDRFDVDGDGYPDILSIVQSDLVAWSVASDGSTTKLFTVPNVGYSAKFGDLDGDGKLDIIDAKGSSIVARFGKGGGNFGPLQVVTTLDAAIGSLQTVDIDGDGKLDLVAGVGSSGVSEYQFLHDDGAAHFSVVKTLAKVKDVSFTFTDATGDGKLDIVLTQKEALAIAPGVGNGKFLDATVITGPWSTAAGVQFFDVDGDGRRDLVAPGSSVAVLLRK